MFWGVSLLNARDRNQIPAMLILGGVEVDGVALITSRRSRGGLSGWLRACPDWQRRSWREVMEAAPPLPPSALLASAWLNYHAYPLHRVDKIATQSLALTASWFTSASGRTSFPDAHIWIQMKTLIGSALLIGASLHQSLQPGWNWLASLTREQVTQTMEWGGAISQSTGCWHLKGESVHSSKYLRHHLFPKQVNETANGECLPPHPAFSLDSSNPSWQSELKQVRGARAKTHITNIIPSTWFLGDYLAIF